ncbi:hypothetical protein GGR57DRAFT_414329 [Xylariaceae sp. FL1272]|nr:hypothetical protein GGR57DRAFT_414329 [Xylariaceae sp. FL1272]
MISKQIAAELVSGDERDMALMKQGFTFDISYDEKEDTVQLVELNVFGARSACGSCLFHWIKDRKTLEGHDDPEDVEIRVSSQKIIDYVSSDEEDDESSQCEYKYHE